MRARMIILRSRSTSPSWRRAAGRCSVADAAATSNAVTLGGVRFDPLAATHHRWATGSMPLRNRELRLFEILLAAPERIYSKTHLIDRLCRFDEDASENAIEVYIGRLRKKLEGGGLKIETVRGLGYRLCVE